MIQKTINLYKFDELDASAKDKALESWNNQYHDYCFLEESLNEYLKELLIEKGVKIHDDGDFKLYYSLSYCQGDGVCFVGNFELNGRTIFVRHNNGHYYHSNSVYIEVEHEDEDEDELRADIIEALEQTAEKEFIEIYDEICDKIEKSGYEQIEYEQSEENFKELCEMNEYTFEIDGTMNNL